MMFSFDVLTAKGEEIVRMDHFSNSDVRGNRYASAGKVLGDVSIEIEFNTGQDLFGRTRTTK